VDFKNLKPLLNLCFSERFFLANAVTQLHLLFYYFHSTTVSVFIVQADAINACRQVRNIEMVHATFKSERAEEFEQQQF